MDAAESGEESTCSVPSSLSLHGISKQPWLVQPSVLGPSSPRSSRSWRLPTQDLRADLALHSLSLPPPRLSVAHLSSHQHTEGPTCPSYSLTPFPALIHALRWAPDVTEGSRSRWGLGWGCHPCVLPETRAPGRPCDGSLPRVAGQRAAAPESGSPRLDPSPCSLAGRGTACGRPPVPPCKLGTAGVDP